MDDDPEIVGRVVGGEAAAFRLLVERHQASVFHLVGAILPDPAEREDAAQEAFLGAWRALSTFDPALGSFRGWLLRIARNRALNLRRGRRRRAALPLPTSAAVPGPDGPAEATDRLDRALAALPERHRMAFLLAEVLELPLSEVAAIEGVALGTIKSRSARARALLRASLLRPVEPRT